MLWSHLFLLLSHVFGATCAPQTFDYIIIGGGPAGLIVANRLSAHANITVAVIEAGDSAYNNPNVTHVPISLLEYGRWIGTSLEWGYMTAPQKYVGNRELSYYAGKALGGSTTINGMTYLRAEKEQVDAWEALGNEGWNWESLLEYYVAQEAFQAPGADLLARGASYEAAAHGKGGELAVGFTPYFTPGFTELLVETSEALGYPFNREPNDGGMRGFNTWPMTLNETGPIRADGARSFYFPVAERMNLHVFLNTTATRILWDKEEEKAGTGTNLLVASGVEIIAANNVTSTLVATKEVLVAAGSIRSPALLEHSGIGNPAVLEPLGIKTVLALPSVGSNLADQPQNGMAFASSKNWTGYPTFVTYLTASDLFGASQLPSLAAELRANISDYAATILADYAPGTIPLSVQEKLLQHQIDLIYDTNSTVPLVEVLWAPVDAQIIVEFWNLLPLSRGAIHVTSSCSSSNTSTATLPPLHINPSFLQLPIDRLVQAAAATRIRAYAATPPLSHYITTELDPGTSLIPPSTPFRDDKWQTWIQKGLNGNSHPVGTCAMAGREEWGGVVDNEGKVYGTRNVRVVDASVFPEQLSGHLSASVYAVGGRFAEGIVGGMG
ncbi:Glucose oxidase [Pyrenophora seminiperda CCB06]|uniref:Glucose oxidase n=1 Tax=Pyrenophora seminiperda CCB06 TaxID=1302712 RepID=A0A3M7M1K1_9PLEO|nr:Glucose oxidase [Pyrenophora seminiperda CCB06]